MFEQKTNQNWTRPIETDLPFSIQLKYYKPKNGPYMKYFEIFKFKTISLLQFFPRNIFYFSNKSNTLKNERVCFSPKP